MICAFLKLKARPVLQQNRDVGGSTVLILMSVPFRLIPPGSILATCATQGRRYWVRGCKTWSKYQDTPPPNVNDFVTSLTKHHCSSVKVLLQRKVSEVTLDQLVASGW
jgi:hypothetical protein